MSRKLQWVVVAVLLVGISGVSAAAPRPEATLRADLQVAKYRHELSDEVAVTLTLANESDQSVFVLRWQTPIEGIEADLFQVERDGQPVPYLGILAKRPAPELSDYVEIAAWDSLSVTFDPSAVYDMAVKGQYVIRYRVDLQDLLVPAPETVPGLEARSFTSRPALLRVESNAASFWVEGREPGEEPFPPQLEIQKKPGGGGGTKYTSCTTTQQNTLVTAESNATSISGKALNYLNTNNTDSGNLYKTWFDASGSKYGWNAVTGNFSAINGAFAQGKATFNCSCRQNYYAYVYPTRPYTIYLCKVFWTAPNLGTDSKAGTLVHEMSHFNVTAGTDDYVYGTAGAKNLAITDPAKATDNADNHEYFAENQK